MKTRAVVDIQMTILTEAFYKYTVKKTASANSFSATGTDLARIASL